MFTTTNGRRISFSCVVTITTRHRYPILIDLQKEWIECDNIRIANNQQDRYTDRIYKAI